MFLINKGPILIVLGSEAPSNDDEDLIADSPEDSDCATENKSTCNQQYKWFKKTENICHDIPKFAEELKLFESVFSGCEVRLVDSLVKLTAIYNKHKLSKSALGDIIDYVNELLPKPNIYPASKYQFLETVEQISPRMTSPKVEYFCAKCFR